MSSARVSDSTSAADERRVSFRRKSIDDGLTVPANSEDYKHISMKQLSSVQLAASAASDVKADVGAVIEAFINLVKGCSGSLDVAVREFCDEVLPEGEVLSRELLLGLAPKIKPSLKLARIGLGVRMLLSIVLTYNDLITDFLVLKEYSEGGEGTRKYFHISIAILAVSTLSNMILAWGANKNKGTKAIGRGVVLAVMQLNPLVHGMNMWRGVGNSEDDAVDPGTVFVMVRVIEIIFEVIPETVLQLFVIYHRKEISWMSVYSI
jgi:hypothetical protein